jgi:thioredoxin 1
MSDATLQNAHESIYQLKRCAILTRQKTNTVWTFSFLFPLLCALNLGDDKPFHLRQYEFPRKFLPEHKLNLNYAYMKKILALALGFLCLISTTGFAEVMKAYDESANAQTELNKALSQAQVSKKKVLVIFGANWCKDCLELDKSMKGVNQSLIEKKFIVVKVDVAQFDKNLGIANAYGNPIKKGIPAAVVLQPDNTLLYATKAGELADARRMGDHGIADFFQKIIKDHP